MKKKVMLIVLLIVAILGIMSFFFVKSFTGRTTVQASGEGIVVRSASFPGSPDSSSGESNQSLCGNGVIDEGEQCDGSNLANQSCLTLGLNFTGGNLSCTTQCEFDTSLCSFCGDGICQQELGENITSCAIDCSNNNETFGNSSDNFTGSSSGGSGGESGGESSDGGDSGSSESSSGGGDGSSGGGDSGSSESSSGGGGSSSSSEQFYHACSVSGQCILVRIPQGASKEQYPDQCSETNPCGNEESPGEEPQPQFSPQQNSIVSWFIRRMLGIG